MILSIFPRGKIMFLHCSTVEKMNRKDQELINALEQRKFADNGENRLYLEHCIKKLKVYSLTDKESFMSLLQQMGLYFRDKSSSVQRYIIEYLSDDTHKDRDVMTEMMKEANSIVRIVSKFIHNHNIDTYIGLVLIEELSKACNRYNACETNDITLIVASLLLAMRDMSIPVGNPQMITDHLISVLTNTDNHVSLNVLNMILHK